jgi:hypothetical protein
MTQDEISPQDIIEMATEVYGSAHADDIKFAKLVAAKEREACAQLCDDPSKYGPEGEWCAAAIRERCKND